VNATNNYTAGDKVWVLERGSVRCYEVRDVATNDGTGYDASKHGDDCYLLLKPKNHGNAWWPAENVFKTEAAGYRYLASEYRKQAAQLLKFAEEIELIHKLAD
jgi:hypothetical protein